MGQDPISLYGLEELILLVAKSYKHSAKKKKKVYIRWPIAGYTLTAWQPKLLLE